MRLIVPFVPSCAGWTSVTLKNRAAATPTAVSISAISTAVMTMRIVRFKPMLRWVSGARWCVSECSKAARVASGMFP